MANDLDKVIAKYIINKFRLFSNLRTKEEDEKIFNTVLYQCFFETVKFIEENANPDNKMNLENKLSKNDIKSAQNLIKKYLQSIPNYPSLLEPRLKTLIDKLLGESINNTKE